MYSIDKITRIIKILYKDYGLSFPFVALHRCLECIYYRIFKPRIFVFNSRQYTYLKCLYNASYKKERAVEVPIVLAYVEEAFGKGILEVGNVLSYYSHVKHDVLDKYEEARGVINEDIVTYSPPKRYDLVFSISTLEHVGWDEVPKEPFKFVKALENMKSLLKPGGKVVVTVPLGYNPEIDHLLKQGDLGFSEYYFLKRISDDNVWKQVDRHDVEFRKCNKDYLFAYEFVVAIYDKP